MMDDMRLFLRTITAFRNYDVQARTSLIVREQNFKRLPARHAQLLASANVSLNNIFTSYHNGITANQDFLSAMCDAGAELFEGYWPDVDPDTVPQDEPSAMDIDKVFSTLRQFMRDWSAEGVQERSVAYGPILHALTTQLFPNRDARRLVRVLVPGAGLCRLSVELALHGFACQANEFSYHMLIAGHYAQNHLSQRHQHRLFPYVDNTCNMFHRADQFFPVDVPDVCVMDAVDELTANSAHFGDLSMVAGDFTEVYRKPEHRGAWNVVASSFFLDTAHNIIEYLEVIWDALAPGGYLVNVGPLLYHFADSLSSSPSPPDTPGSASTDGVQSIELSLDELIAVAQAIGFAVHTPPNILETSYTGNNRSMKQMMYRVAFFVLQKPSADQSH
jgi:carnosine N-methyltransferase